MLMRPYMVRAILEPLAAVFTFLMCSFLRVLNSALCQFHRYNTMNSRRKEFCKQRWFVNPEQDETSGPGAVVVEAVKLFFKTTDVRT